MALWTITSECSEEINQAASPIRSPLFRKYMTLSNSGTFMAIKYILSLILISLVAGCASHKPELKVKEECVSPSTRELENQIFAMMNVHYRSFESDLSFRQLQNSFGYLHRKDMSAITSARALLSRVEKKSQQLLKMKSSELEKYNDNLCRMPRGSSTIEKEISTLVGIFNPQSGVFSNIREYIDNSERIIQKTQMINEALMAEKRTEAEADFDRKKSYLSLKSGRYKVENALIQVEDFKDSTLSLSVENISKNKIIKSNFSRCKTIVNKLGGEECLWLSNGLKAIDQYKNEFLVYGHYSQNIIIHPNEKKMITIRMEKPLISSMLTLMIPSTVLGINENITLNFPANFNSKLSSSKTITTNS
jgi:sugar-specific transcriptional regulator TrmB